LGLGWRGVRRIKGNIRIRAESGYIRERRMIFGVVVSLSKR